MQKIFRDFQAGQTLYILIKDDKLKYEESSAVSVSPARTDVQQNNQAYPNPMQNLRQVRDITYTIGDQTFTDIADVNSSLFSTSKPGAPTLVSTEKEFVINELKETLKQSEKLIKDIDKHKKRIKECKTLIAEIDTEYNEKVQTENRLSKLEESSIKTNELLQQLLEKINKNKLF